MKVKTTALNSATALKPARRFEDNSTAHFIQRKYFHRSYFSVIIKYGFLFPVFAILPGCEKPEVITEPKDDITAEVTQRLLSTEGEFLVEALLQPNENLACILAPAGGAAFSADEGKEFRDALANFYTHWSSNDGRWTIVIYGEIRSKPIRTLGIGRGRVADVVYLQRACFSRKDIVNVSNGSFDGYARNVTFVKEKS